MPTSAPRSPQYVVGERVLAVIDGIFPFGVFVRLEDGSPGYIRLRELSLEGDARGLTAFQVRQQIPAIVLETPGEGHRYLLSHRLTLGDPWSAFFANRKEDDIVTGTVCALTSDAATVEIEPGIRGYIPLRELASWPVEEPRDVLWIDDQVQARIIRMQHKAPRLTLSIRRLLERAAFYASVLQRIDHQSDAPAVQVELPLPASTETIALPLPVLIVDDVEQLRVSVAQRLSAFGCQVVCAASSAEAVQLAQDSEFALIIADLDMPDMNGVELLSQLRANGCEAPIAIMSDPAYIVENMPALLPLDIAAALPKPLEITDVQALLQGIAQGERPRVVSRGWIPLDDVPDLQPLTTAADVAGPIAERMQKLLEDAVRDTGATQGAVFRMDAVSLQIDIVASTPALQPSSDLLYGLRESPVKDVIAENQPLLEHNVKGNPLQSRRFARLLLLLSFESCLAIPLRAGGQVDTALFLFHRDPNMFHVYRQRDARAAATLMSAALQNEATERQTRELSNILLSGQLAAGFGHEVHNKLAILMLQLENLRNQFEALLQALQEETEQPIADASAALNATMAASAELQRTVRDFRRLMGPRERELFDVNEAVRQAEALIRPIARRGHVTVKTELDPALPHALGSSLDLQQVVLNLLYNATEHTAAKKDPTRTVTVSTRCVSDQERKQSDAPRIEIRVADTGPGIHKRLWDRVFELGFTTRGREGSGLGLFIARILLRAMRGQIRIESSYVPLGTTFLIEIPAA